MKTIELNKCKDCDYICESKQGIKCFNPNSEHFNQKVKLDDGCDKIETNYHTYQKEDSSGLFND